MSTSAPSVPALRAQLLQLQARHDAGTLADGAYRQTREALERQIIGAIVHAPAGSAAPPPPAASSRRRRNGISLVALTLAVALAGASYWLTVASERQAPPLAGAAPGADGADPTPPHAMGRDQMAAVTQRLVQRLQTQPDDAEGWATLGRSYAAMGQPEPALAAYERVLELKPDNAGVMADYADALAVKNGRSLEGEPMKWIDRALEIEPDNLKALALAGTAAFNRGDNARAVQHWDRAQRVGPQDHPLVRQMSAGAADARERGKLPPVPARP